MMYAAEAAVRSVDFCFIAHPFPQILNIVLTLLYHRGGQLQEHFIRHFFFLSGERQKSLNSDGGRVVRWLRHREATLFCRYWGPENEILPMVERRGQESTADFRENARVERPCGGVSCICRRLGLNFT